MNSRAYNLQTNNSRLWPAATLILIAMAIAMIGRLNGLENLVYDYFQQYQYKTANDQILLLTVDSRTEMQKNIWNDDHFNQITKTLNKHGARLIVATQPLNLPDVPNEKQIRALTKLQEQARRSYAPGPELSQANQLDGFRNQYDQRGKFIAELKNSGNVVLTAYSTDFAGENSTPQNCKKHEINFQDITTNTAKTIRLIRYLTVPTAAVCKAAITIGFSNFWADTDGIVRSTDLLINANGVYLPSLALATAAALNTNNQSIFATAKNTLVFGRNIIHTGKNFQILNRYYNSTTNQPAFRTESISSVLSDQLSPSVIKDRIILIGESSDAAMPGINTPINPHMSPLEMSASSLSNILEQDYLIRPDWLPLLENGLLLAILVLVLLWVPTMPTIGATLMGFILATLIIGIEAWIIISKGIWAQFATVAIFSAVSVWTMHIWNMATLRQTRATKSRPKAAPPKPKAAQSRPKAKPIHNFSEQSALDLEFSVLRQQVSTDETKGKMYDIAQTHIKAKEFARAERVLTHIAAIDPNFKNVSEMLNKLSGAKIEKKKTAQQKASAVSLPTDRRKLGRYEIDHILGRGAMATVYLGRDPKINRKVAIKTVALAKEFDEAQLKDARIQFRREAESAGRLNHPNIIAIYDAGEDDDVSYLAMEYFKGTSLLQHIQPDNLMPPKRVMELVARAAEALDYAHRQNVVHRDIKPANLMYHAATDTLKLTDFGIARLTDSSRTKTGIILGTPSYMSPEQLSACGVTGQSDLYSLGVTMYQLLTGTAPFRADSIPKLMDKIMNEKHRPASEIRNDLPKCIDSIINKIMAKNPNERFINGREIAIQLRECIKNLNT
ncbi:MAG: protein kinase [Gammaproteobacteria bacterium]|nr:protein kinase [Gammaproteobacteria bacterium]MCP4091134.1 protein kinase [Gammaproteobacteria bacterium]MCP4277340.1 protein kinase [Gammaproteobacteria bacterium]MCP4831599.1 protein kinase [Gammaproteobacteria bacterium]MCP4927822.1 protein kinase [Gammaproteobacteria bacterium]